MIDGFSRRAARPMPSSPSDGIVKRSAISPRGKEAVVAARSGAGESSTTIRGG